jgi:hypothetical protein
VEHIQELEAFPTADSVEYNQWTDTRLDRWLVDWALRTGKPETARSLTKAKGLEVSTFYLRTTVLILVPFSNTGFIALRGY